MDTKSTKQEAGEPTVPERPPSALRPFVSFRTLCGHRLSRRGGCWLGLIGLALIVTRFLAAQGYKPEEAPKRMAVVSPLSVKLVAAEPLVRQPVAIDFDDRGRLWVIQYLQYPNPAGLERVKVDRYSRTVYDRVPEPPPRGPKGADRITILDDLDENGRARKAKDFVGGLNLGCGVR